MRLKDKLILLYLEGRRENLCLRIQIARDKSELIQINEEGRMQELDCIRRDLGRVLGDNPNNS